MIVPTAALEFDWWLQLSTTNASYRVMSANPRPWRRAKTGARNSTEARRCLSRDLLQGQPERSTPFFYFSFLFFLGERGCCITVNIFQADSRSRWFCHMMQPYRIRYADGRRCATRSVISRRSNFHPAFVVGGFTQRSRDDDRRGGRIE